MNIEEIRDFCLSLKAVEESMPFDDKILVFSIKKKMFCSTDLSNSEYINVKCDPERAEVLRDRYKEITPGRYMNKKHWNSISLKGDLPSNMIKDMITQSFHLVISKLPKKDRDNII